MAFYVAALAIAFVGLLAYCLIEYILCWGGSFKSSLNDILLANVYTPVTFACYILTIIAGIDYMDKKTFSIILAAIKILCNIFIMVAGELALIKRKKERETPDYAGFIGMVVLAFFFLLTFVIISLFGLKH